MELGLDYATGAGDGAGGMTYGTGVTTSSTIMSPPPQMMEHYEFSNQDPMSRMIMGGQSNNTPHAHHPTMEYGPPSSNSNTTIPAASTQQGPPKVAMDYSSSATAQGPPMLSPAHHYTMQMHSSTNSDMIPMNRPMQNHSMHSSFSNTNHQSRLPPQLYTNPAMMYPGNHPGTTDFTTASSSRNATGGGGMYPGIPSFQHHPIASNTATHGNMMNSNSNTTAMMHHHPTVSNSTNRTVAQQQGQLNGPVMMHGHPNGPRGMQGQSNGSMMQGQLLNGGNMMQGQSNEHLMQGQQNGPMMQGQQRGPMMQGQSNRHMMQGHPNNIPMMQGQPNNGPMMQGHPNNGPMMQGHPKNVPMMPNEPHFRYSATNNTHKGPMMQGHPTFMMYQNAMGMHSNNQFSEYPPNQRFSPYQPFPVGHYESPNGYPQSQYMNHVIGGMIPHGQNSMAASYPTPSTANNGGLTMESNNAPLPEKGITIESRTKGRKGAKLKSKRLSINSMTNDTGVQDRADEDNAEDGESHSFPRTEMSDSANVNHPGTNDQIKDDSSVNNMVDKLPETSENEKQSSSSQNDDVNFNEEKIDFSMKGSRNHHGDCSSQEPSTKRVKENN
jgi:hypothetical protein